ncbi:MAG: acyl-ACP--UDP-N-acetylglucosamine O-acyltransferase [Pseudomonadota bacterium]
MAPHPTAHIDPSAKISGTATIGPYCVIGPGVEIAEDVVLQSHVVVTGNTVVGARTVVHAFAVLGGPPQHAGYKGEPTRLEIGTDNLIREHVTMNLGTPQGRGITTIGNKGMFMAACHVAHDCQVADNVIFANNATIGGHVVIEEGAFLGGLSAIHQNCRVGAFAFIGGCAAVPTDVIPYGSAIGNHAELGGLNLIGLKRRGASRHAIHDLREAYRDLFADDGAFRERLDKVATKYQDSEEVSRIVAFIRADTKRPLMTPRR